jgi:hypothetical protein
MNAAATTAVGECVCPDGYPLSIRLQEMLLRRCCCKGMLALSTLALVLLLQVQSVVPLAEGRPQHGQQRQQRDVLLPTPTAIPIATGLQDSDPALQRRAQFWAGWPKTTVTLVQTVTANG